jgi:hypothetical protein
VVQHDAVVWCVRHARQSTCSMNADVLSAVALVAEVSRSSRQGNVANSQMRSLIQRSTIPNSTLRLYER